MSYGFIILRHVNNELTNQYWIKSVHCIRKFYPDNHIIIIDDNSDTSFITDEPLHNTSIIHSKYYKRGELLPYLYYLDNKLFDVAVILHDSVFINSKLDLSVENYKFLWNFPSHPHNEDYEITLLKLFNDEHLTDYYKQKQWKGCFGGMSIITHNYLKQVNDKYDMKKLINGIHNRESRCCFERVFAILLQMKCKEQTLLGCIHDYCPWGIPFHEIDKYNYLPIIKCWTGR
jgi:hypothetical protein